MGLHEGDKRNSAHLLLRGLPFGSFGKRSFGLVLTAVGGRPVFVVRLHFYVSPCLREVHGLNEGCCWNQNCSTNLAFDTRLRLGFRSSGRGFGAVVRQLVELVITICNCLAFWHW